MVVETLQRPDVTLESLSPDTDLEQLGIDSIDRIQLAVRIQRRFGLRLAVLEQGASETFRSVRRLVQCLEVSLRERPVR
jgi:acyl carrier protein